MRQGDATKKKKYGNMRTAAAKIAALAANDGKHEIPVQIPAHCTEMQKFGYTNLAEAVTSVRNDIVHPEPRVSPNPRLLLEARDCSLWLLEMLLLRLFDYDGPYSDRREPNKAAGLVSPVPWK